MPTPPFPPRSQLSDSESLASGVSAGAPTISAGLIVRVAEEVWRLDRWLGRVKRLDGQPFLEGIQDAVDRLHDALLESGVRAVDNQGRPYDDGMRLDILHVEGDPEPGQPLWIIETVRPGIELQGRALSVGQVILGTTPPVEDAR
jgi:hypothetical protein